MSAPQLWRFTDGADCRSWSLGLVNAGPKVFSQGNQDGVLKDIFAIIGTTNTYFVEFGFGYEGRTINESVMDHADSGLNTRYLYKQGWHGMYFDAVVSAPEFNITQATLTEDNIGHHFTQAGIPREPDYVSIDVDSLDVWLLRGMLTSGFRPRVLSVEFNSNFPADALVTFQPQWHAWTRRTIYGAGAGVTNKLAESFGYVPVFCMEYMDIFFVRGDELQRRCDLLTVPSFRELTKHLPYRLHPKCQYEDLERVLDFPLAIDGRWKEANEKAVRTIKGLNMCEESAFDQYYAAHNASQPLPLHRP